MYRMKNINSDDVLLSLPKCMYHVRNPIDFSKADENNINISQQVIKLLKAPNPKMAELEQRQDLLLKKLDLLYDRIKTISSYCKLNGFQDKNVERKTGVSILQAQAKRSKTAFKVFRKFASHTRESNGLKSEKILTPGEVVLVSSPDNLPWFLNILLSQTSFTVNMTWHIHSSVPNEKVPIIKSFIKNLKLVGKNAGLQLRLIFKCVSADPELKLSSLAIPILGNVNILRYLSYVYPNAIPYDSEDYYVDGLLDLCHVLERTPEKNREVLINKLFSQCNNWIHENKFSIVDLAAYCAIKQWRSIPKSVPKTWFDNCNKLCV